MIIDKKIMNPACATQISSATFSIKSVGENGRFAGYASVFGVVDSQRDIIARGAFAKTLKDRIGSIKLLWQHRMDEPIGVLNKMFEDARGLYVEGQLLLNVQRAQEAYALLKSGAIGGLSIGYTPVSFKFDAEQDVRILTELELWEVSVVTFPANEAAGVTVVKQANARYERPEPCEMSDRAWKQAQSSGQMIALAEALERAASVLNRPFA